MIQRHVLYGSLKQALHGSLKFVPGSWPVAGYARAESGFWLAVEEIKLSYHIMDIQRYIVYTLEFPDYSSITATQFCDLGSSI